MKVWQTNFGPIRTFLLPKFWLTMSIFQNIVLRCFKKYCYQKDLQYSVTMLCPFFIVHTNGNQGESKRIIFYYSLCTGLHSFIFVYFWLNSLFFMALDTFEPAFFMKYKIQEDKRVSRADLWKAVRVCVRNQFIGFLFSFLLYAILVNPRTMTYESEELPTFQWFLVELCVYILVEEVGFYYTHRFVELFVCVSLISFGFFTCVF